MFRKLPDHIREGFYGRVTVVTERFTIDLYVTKGVVKRSVPALQAWKDVRLETVEAWYNRHKDVKYYTRRWDGLREHTQVF